MQIMQILASLGIGYLLGALSPAALLSKIKQIDFRKKGTGNLGATNTMLLLGKGYGALVMLVDIGKAFLASKLAKLLFPQLAAAGLLAGAAAVVGHIFPFYMHFKGGKGLASFGGMVLAYDPRMFLGLLCAGVVLMLAVNYSVVLPMMAAAVFPVLVALHSGDLLLVLISAATGLLVIVKHWSIIGKVRRGEEIKVRDFLRKK